MRVLITGASGLIGSALADALLARGDEVVGLPRDPERARSRNPTVRWHAWRATTERPPPEALQVVNGVGNLIGEEINQPLPAEAQVRPRPRRPPRRRGSEPPRAAGSGPATCVRGRRLHRTSRACSSDSPRSATTATV